jgi:hypothetical protein
LSGIFLKKKEKSRDSGMHAESKAETGNDVKINPEQGNIYCY